MIDWIDVALFIGIGITAWFGGRFFWKAVRHAR